MKKSLLLPLLLSFSLLFTTAVSAQVNPDYGENPYDNDKSSTAYKMYGDMQPSGLSDGYYAGRFTNPLWHAMQVVNISTNEYKPINPAYAFEVGPNSGKFTPTVTYEILPKNAGETIKDSGYHLIPAEESVIRRYAANANGNADFVWNAITWPMVSGQYDSNLYGVRYYRINGEWYVQLPKVMQLSGGGQPTEDYITENDGVTKPRIISTYKITPWPFLNSFESRENGQPATKLTKKGSLYVDGKTWSVYDKEANVGFAVNGVWIDDNGDGRVDIIDQIKNPNAGEYMVEFKKEIPISKIANHLKAGINKVKVRLFDKYERKIEQEIQFEYIPGENIGLRNEKATPSGPQLPGTTVVLKVDVVADLPITLGPIDAKVEFKDGGKVIGSKNITISDKQTVPVNVLYKTQNDNRVHTYKVPECPPDKYIHWCVVQSLANNTGGEPCTCTHLFPPRSHSHWEAFGPLSARI
ncbi:hypothetical protein [Brevibacillus thermoruber]|uniref:hypothetical protein n=1 Tax=Brevibacillus thermoruber TaxID=33942 RepID=UPI00054F9061|nr:hypothetical protein [Brevibacillus thermoruber]